MSFVRQAQAGTEVIRLFVCSIQLSMKFSLLINMKMPTDFGIFMIYHEAEKILYLGRLRKETTVLWYLLAGKISC